MAVDPLTTFYDKLVEVISGSSVVNSAVVNAAHRVISFNDKDLNHQQQPLGDGDLPELLVIPAPGTVELDYASNLVRIDKSYNLALTVGDWILGSYLYPIEWALIATFWKAQHDGTFEQLKFRDSSFVKDVRLVSVENGESNPSGNRGIQGLISVMAINAVMTFYTADIEEYLGP